MELPRLDERDEQIVSNLRKKHPVFANLLDEDGQIIGEVFGLTIGSAELKKL